MLEREFARYHADGGIEVAVLPDYPLMTSALWLEPSEEEAQRSAFRRSALLEGMVIAAERVIEDEGRSRIELDLRPAQSLAEATRVAEQIRDFLLSEAAGNMP